MLQLMREHVGNWIIKILLSAIAIAFALSWGVYNYGDPKTVAMTVNGEPINETQIRDEQVRITEQMRKQYGQQFDLIAPMLKIKEQAKEALIQKILLAQAAMEMGIQVGEAEIQAYIMNMPVFKKLGRFDRRVYERMLVQNRYTPDTFEAALRGEIRLEKLLSLVSGSAQVTPLEVDQAMISQLSKIKGVYKVFPFDDYLEKVKVTDSEIKTWYDNHKRQFLVPEKLELTYVNFPLAKYRDQADVLDSDIEEAYEIDRARYYKPEQVKARHILFKLPEKAAEAEIAAAKKKAEEVLDLAKKAGVDFAELAKKYSQGPTASQGGDLGYFTKGQMVPAFEKLAFELKKDAVGLVKTRFGWHVVKTEDHKQASVTPLDKVKGEIKARLVERQAKDLAEAAAERAFDLAAQGVNPKELAQKTGGSLQETAEFSIKESVPGLKGLKGLKEAQQDLEQGQVLNVMNYDNGSIVAYIKKRVPETVQPLKDVDEKVRLFVKDEKAQESAKNAAAKLLTELAKKPEPAKAFLAEKNAKETEWLTREDSIVDLDNSYAVIDALFMRPNAKPVLRTPVKSGKAYVAACKVGVQKPTAEKMAEDRQSFTQRLLAGKRRIVAEKFVKDLRAAAEIKVNVKK